jgi:catechol 2,3-dioxygenase-like lactoylglutathione lyase family enzyme
MPLTHLEHFLIQVEDIAATRAWYERVLGLKAGYTPDFKFPVCWLYLGDRDVLHVTEGGANVSDNRKKYVGQQSTATRGTGVIDHVGFRCTGLGETLAHLAAEGVEFQTRQVDDQGLFQVFLFDPNGIKIELNFANSEAKDVAPGLKASAL